MKIQVGGLSEGIHEYHFEADPSEIGLENGFSRGILVDTVLEKTGNQIFLRATVHTHGSFECDRCVSHFEAPISSSLQTCYVTDGAEVVHVDPEELQVVSPGLNIIDIAEDVRQTLLLAIPLKLLCSDTCRGLCPRCGKNLNTGPCTCAETTTDSRWEKLRELQQNKLRDIG